MNHNAVLRLSAIRDLQLPINIITMYSSHEGLFWE